MRTKILIYFLFFSYVSFGQGTKFVFVKDAKTKEPLAFATIYTNTTHRGVITNIEGNALVYFASIEDELIISFVGYKKLKIKVKNISETGVILLSQNTVTLKTATVVAFQDQDFIAKLLRKVVKENKKHIQSETSKTTLITESTVNGVPLERQESIGNSLVSNNGIQEYKVKIGRFGQNKSFNFYTLTATDFVSKFQPIVNRNSSPFPTLVTELSKRKIKKRFELSYTKNPYGEEELTKIEFVSKSGKEFSGELLFYTKTRKLKKIVFEIMNPAQQLFFPVIETHQVDVKKIRSELVYNDIFHRIDFVNIDYELDYKTPESHSIKSSLFFSFEDYESNYSNPYYTGKIDFKGEYHQILFNSFDERFWNENFSYSQSETVNKTYDFFKKNGYVANYQKYSSDSLFQFLDLRIKNWDTTRISMKELNYNSSDFGIRENDILSEHGRYTYSELYNIDVQFYFNYFLYIDNGKYTSILPKINFNNSYYFLLNEWYSDIMLNICFDIYQVEVNKIVVSNNVSKKEISIFYKNGLNNYKNFMKISNRGTDIDSLIKWNEIIIDILNIDNINMLYNGSINNLKSIKFIEENSGNIKKGYLPNYYNIGTSYLHLKKYEKAVYFFNLTEKEINDKIKFFEIDIKDILHSEHFSKKEIQDIVNLLHNRSLAFIELKDFEKACADLQFASELGDTEAEKLMEKHCK